MKVSGMCLSAIIFLLLMVFLPCRSDDDTMGSTVSKLTNSRFRGHFNRIETPQLPTIYSTIPRPQFTEVNNNTATVPSSGEKSRPRKVSTQAIAIVISVVGFVMLAKLLFSMRWCCLGIRRKRNGGGVIAPMPSAEVCYVTEIVAQDVVILDDPVKVSPRVATALPLPPAVPARAAAPMPVLI